MKTFLLKHPIDISLLTNGFHIPTEFHAFVYAMCGELRHGENIPIKILMEGNCFDAKLYNINFDRSRYPKHPDLLQIRYTPNSPIAKNLQTIYHREYELLLRERKVAGPRKQIRLPKEYEYNFMIFYCTSVENTFIMECDSAINQEETRKQIQLMAEEEFEMFTPQEDATASLKEVTRIQYVRQLDRSIGDSLKRLYGFRCQMTGEFVGEPYGVICVEAHHIIPFTKSLNNDSSNIIILSPSYHRIVHKAKPHFNRDSLTFEYANGLVEKIKIDKHLRL